MDTVRIEYMMLNADNSIIMNWTPYAGSVQNDPQIYMQRAYQAKRPQNCSPYTIRVRVVSEQTNRIVDIIQ